MNIIQSTIQASIPPSRKLTQSGWESFNAICCHHNGENRDTKKRSGIRFDNDGFVYHCFNCSFGAGWIPGKVFSENTRKFLSWINISENDIQRLSLEAIKSKNDLIPIQKSLDFALELRELPKNCLTINEWVQMGTEDTELLAIAAYILDRGMDLDWYPWMWSSENGYRDRVIIPFYYENNIVGWTGRKINNGKPKYLTTTQPGYVFNLDRQTYDRKYVIVVEGQFDAIAIDGCAIMHNDPNEMQITRLNALGREVIVVPDNDKPGAKMVKTAMEQNWSVSLPEWGDDIKDVSDAVKKFGRIYTLFTILKYRVHGQIKLNMLKRKLENVPKHQSGSKL